MATRTTCTASMPTTAIPTPWMTTATGRTSLARSGRLETTAKGSSVPPGMWGSWRSSSRIPVVVVPPPMPSPVSTTRWRTEPTSSATVGEGGPVRRLWSLPSSRPEMRVSSSWLPRATTVTTPTPTVTTRLRTLRTTSSQWRPPPKAMVWRPSPTTAPPRSTSPRLASTSTQPTTAATPRTPLWMAPPWLPPWWPAAWRFSRRSSRTRSISPLSAASMPVATPSPDSRAR